VAALTIFQNLELSIDLIFLVFLNILQQRISSGNSYYKRMTLSHRTASVNSDDILLE